MMKQHFLYLFCVMAIACLSNGVYGQSKVKPCYQKVLEEDYFDRFRGDMQFSYEFEDAKSWDFGNGHQLLAMQYRDPNELEWRDGLEMSLDGEPFEFDIKVTEDDFYDIKAFHKTNCQCTNEMFRLDIRARLNVEKDAIEFRMIYEFAIGHKDGENIVFLGYGERYKCRSYVPCLERFKKCSYVYLQPQPDGTVKRWTE